MRWCNPCSERRAAARRPGDHPPDGPAHGPHPRCRQQPGRRRRCCRAGSGTRRFRPRRAGGPRRSRFRCSRRGWRLAVAAGVEGEDRGDGISTARLGTGFTSVGVPDAGTARRMRRSHRFRVIQRPQWRHCGRRCTSRSTRSPRSPRPPSRFRPLGTRRRRGPCGAGVFALGGSGEGAVDGGEELLEAAQGRFGESR